MTYAVKDFESPDRNIIYFIIPEEAEKITICSKI